MNILVAEDEVKLAQAIERVLKLNNHQVRLVHDGETAYDLASSQHFDLILLDVMMPKLSGIEVCSALRDIEVQSPIIMLTAKGETQDRVSGLDAGADDYVVKPFAFAELLSRIRAVTRRAHTDGEKLQVADLRLDLKTFTAHCSGKILDLSAKEFAILAYLVQNKNQVRSKKQIIEHVWDYDADVLPSTIEVHIKNIRDKVDEPCRKALIHTIRGRGYVVSDEKA